MLYGGGGIWILVLITTIYTSNNRNMFTLNNHSDLESDGQMPIISIRTVYLLDNMNLLIRNTKAENRSLSIFRGTDPKT